MDCYMIVKYTYESFKSHTNQLYFIFSYVPYYFLSFLISHVNKLKVTMLQILLLKFIMEFSIIYII